MDFSIFAQVQTHRVCVHVHVILKMKFNLQIRVGGRVKMIELYIHFDFWERHTHKQSAITIEK